MNVSKIPAELLVAKRQWFAANGIAIAEWARQNDVDYRILYAILHGKNQGLRGQGHKIAVLLGLKPAAPGSQPVEASPSNSSLQSASTANLRPLESFGASGTNEPKNPSGRHASAALSNPLQNLGGSDEH